jgi:hypothetical protein
MGEMQYELLKVKNNHPNMSKIRHRPMSQSLSVSMDSQEY